MCPVFLPKSHVQRKKKRNFRPSVDVHAKQVHAGNDFAGMALDSTLSVQSMETKPSVQKDESGQTWKLSPALNF